MNNGITLLWSYKMVNTRNLFDKIQGCLIGGAAGDALGYTVEFLEYEQIQSLYGEKEL